MKILKSLIYIVFAFGLLMACKTQKVLKPVVMNHVSDVDVYYEQVNEETSTNDPAIDAMISPYTNKLAAEMNEVIASLETTMYKGRPSSNMGNWLADLLHEEAELLVGKPVDFAIQNYGGIRIGSVNKGDITVMKVFEIMPFDNELLVMTISGDLIQQLCNRMAESGGWPISYGLKMEVLDNVAVKVIIGDQPLDLSQNYTIALPDYIAEGGGKCFFLENLEKEKTGLMIREVMIKNLKRKTAEGKTIQPSKDKRTIIQ